MTRRVSAQLEAEVSRYKREVADATKTTRGLGGSLNDAAKAGDRTARAMDNVADEMGDVARAASKADREVADLQRSLRQLSAQQLLTGDKSLSKQIREQESALRNLTRLRKKLGDTFRDGGTESADGFALSFVHRLGPLLARAPVSPPLMIAFAGATPLIAASISAGILAGLAGGTVAAGVKLALADPAVKKEADAFGLFLAEEFTSAAASFKPATIGAIRAVRPEVVKLRGDLRQIFDEGAKFVLPLTRGVTGFVKGVLPGIKDGLQDAAPVVAAMEQGFIRMGRAIGEAISTIAGGATGAATALMDLILITEQGIRATGIGVRALTEMYQAMRFATSLNKVEVLTGMAEGKAAGLEFEAALEKVKKEIGNLAGAVADFRTPVQAYAGNMKTLADETKRVADEHINAFNALISWEQALDDANKAVKENGKQVNKQGTELDLSTEKGRANATALSRMAEAANTATQKAIDQAAAQKNSAAALQAAATKAFNYRQQLIDTGIRMGLTREAAIRYADSLGRVPKALLTQVSVSGIPATIGEINRLKAYIASIPRYKSVTIEGNVRVSGGQILRRWGGITEHAQSGLLREAATFTPSEPARYAFAEPATGGEAFVPKFGDYQRSMSILNRAAGWYGASVTPGRGGGGVQNFYFSLHAGVVGSSTELERWFGRMYHRTKNTGQLQP